MQPTDSLTTLFRHNLWANLRLLEQCAGLTGEQLNTGAPGGYGSIQDTLEHIVTAERSYFSRISTGKRHPRLEGESPMSVAQMLEISRQSGAGLVEWATRVQAEDVVQVDWEGTPLDMPVTILLVQAINHATEHRAQVAAILTQLGIQPVDMDAWTYFAEVLK